MSAEVGSHANSRPYDPATEGWVMLGSRDTIGLEPYVEKSGK